MSDTIFEGVYKIEIDANMNCENIEVFIGVHEDYKTGDTHFKDRPIVTLQDADGVMVIGVCNDSLNEQKKPKIQSGEHMKVCECIYCVSKQL